MFKERRNAKFRTEILEFKHSSHIYNNKIQLRQTVEEVSCNQSHIVTEKSVFRNSIYVYCLIGGSIADMRYKIVWIGLSTEMSCTRYSRKYAFTITL